MAIDWYTRVSRDLEGSLSAMGAVINTGDEMADPHSLVYQFSAPSLNWACGGGLPAGKVMVAYGPESSGKSFLLWDLIKNMQRRDAEGWAAVYDAEFSYDKSYVASLGVDTKRLLVVQSNQSDDIFDHFVDKVGPMIQDGYPIRVMGIDSIRSIRGPKESALKQTGDHMMADLAILLPKATKKMVGLIRQYGIAQILIQQVNEEMDPNKVKYEHKKWHVPNGQALKHYADLMVLVEKINSKDRNVIDVSTEQQLGHTVRAKVEKNRVGTPYRVSEFQLLYGVGVVNTHVEVATMATKLKVVERPNNLMYKFGGQSWKGIKAFAEAIKESDSLREGLMAGIMEVKGGGEPPAMDSDAEAMDAEEEVADAE